MNFVSVVSQLGLLITLSTTALKAIVSLCTEECVDIPYCLVYKTHSCMRRTPRFGPFFWYQGSLKIQ